MIEIKKIEIPKVDLYDSNNNFLAQLNEYEFLDVRVQIKKQKLKGYFCVFNNQRIDIDSNGTLSCYPKGMFDQLGNLYFELLGF